MTKALRIVFFVMLPAAFFYLFVFPALVATYTMEPSIWSIAFAAFLYVQLWMLVASYAYEGAAALYGFQPKRATSSPFPRLYVVKSKSERYFRVVALCSLSYFVSIYGFAIAYTFLSHVDPLALSDGPLTLFTAIYFSLITAATVGFGDIAPVSATARLLVMLEIIVNLLYVVFLFSLLAASGNVVREADTDSSDAV